MADRAGKRFFSVGEISLHHGTFGLIVAGGNGNFRCAPRRS